MIRILLERLWDNGGSTIFDHIRLSTLTATVIPDQIDEGGDVSKKHNRKISIEHVK